MRNEATEEMLVFTTEVCWKYEQVKTIVEGAEASWKQNLEMAATSQVFGRKGNVRPAGCGGFFQIHSGKRMAEAGGWCSGKGQREKGASCAEAELFCRCHHEVNSAGQKDRNLYEPVNRNEVWHTGVRMQK